MKEPVPVCIEHREFFRDDLDCPVCLDKVAKGHARTTLQGVAREWRAHGHDYPMMSVWLTEQQLAEIKSAGGLPSVDAASFERGLLSEVRRLRDWNARYGHTGIKNQVLPFSNWSTHPGATMAKLVTEIAASYDDSVHAQPMA